MGIAKAYGPYEDWLADPEIEAIYNPCPTSSMCPERPMLAAERAHTHALREKPMALNTKDLLQF